MNENPRISGIHHITAVASSASENLAFYKEVLGLRLVKKTVNFDDPYTYHLYYGDAAGTPGTIITFFPGENLPRGKTGELHAHRRRDDPHLRDQHNNDAKPYGIIPQLHHHRKKDWDSHHHKCHGVHKKSADKIKKNNNAH